MAEHRHMKVAVESYCPDCGEELGRADFERQSGATDSTRGHVAASVGTNGSIAASGAEELAVAHAQHDHPVVEVRGYCPDCGEEFDRKSFDRRQLTEGRALDVRPDGSFGYAQTGEVAPARPQTTS